MTPTTLDMTRTKSLIGNREDDMPVFFVPLCIKVDIYECPNAIADMDSACVVLGSWIATKSMIDRKLGTNAAISGQPFSMHTLPELTAILRKEGIPIIIEVDSHEQYLRHFLVWGATTAQNLCALILGRVNRAART